MLTDITQTMVKMIFRKNIDYKKVEEDTKEIKNS